MLKAEAESLAMANRQGGRIPGLPLYYPLTIASYVTMEKSPLMPSLVKKDSF